MANGFILFHGKVMVPRKEELRRDIMSHFHDSLVGGHSIIYRTWARITTNFYWKGMKTDV